MARLMNLDRQYMRSSQLGTASEDRSDRILQICQSLGATTLYDGRSAKSFLDVSRFTRCGISVEFQDYIHPVYSQLWGEFVPYLSAIDLLFNCGPEALPIILKGHATA
jgi:hypothetical protein